MASRIWTSTLVGKKARRRYVSAHAPTGEKVVIWIKSSTHWRDLAEAVRRFPWKKLSVSPDGQSAVAVACEGATQRGATHLLAASGNDHTGVLSFARLYPLARVPALVAEQATLINSVFYRAHSAALIVRASIHQSFSQQPKLLRMPAMISCRRPHDPPAGSRKNNRSLVAGRGPVYRRDPKLREKVLAIANGHCECCGEEGFITASGGRYLETHHVVGVSERGPDATDNIIAVCPTCHRKAHFAADRIEVERRMSEAIYRRGRKVHESA